MDLEPDVSAALSNLLSDIGSAVKLEYVVDTDAAGEPAMWVWVVLADAAVPAWVFDKRKSVREAISESLWDAGWPHAVYIRFRAESDPSSGLGEGPVARSG
jgi:hypothetical protein